MKKEQIITLAAFAALMTSCNKIVGEGMVTKETYTVSATAPKVSVSADMELILDKNLADGEVVVFTHENIQSYVEIEHNSKAVSFTMSDGQRYGDIDVEIRVSATQFNDLNASGSAGILKYDTTSFENYSISLSGDSDFEGNVTAKSKLTLQLSGDSDAEIEGCSTLCEINASGASSVDGDKFICEDLVVDLSGSSEVEMQVNNSITGMMSGSSELKYGGLAGDIDVALSGTAKIERD